jgi:hypothetical protein
MKFGVNRPPKIITRSNLKASVQAYEDVRLLGIFYFPKVSNGLPSISLRGSFCFVSVASEYMWSLSSCTAYNVQSNGGFCRCNAEM